MSTYVAIGSVCWDVVEGDPQRRLGGSVLFASRVAVAAGWDARLITSGTEELERALRAELPDVDITVQRSPQDTVMWFSRQADLGPQVVPTVADPIDLGSIELGQASVVHLAPIMGEVTPQLVQAVRAAPFVGITPQGLLRSLDDSGTLLRLPDLDAWWAPQVQAAVVSEEEFALVSDPTALADLALAITRGERGCIGRFQGEQIDIAGVPVGSVAPTGTIGAGDVFAAAFFVSLADGLPFGQALERANRTAAAHVGGDT